MAKNRLIDNLALCINKHAIKFLRQREGEEEKELEIAPEFVSEDSVTYMPFREGMGDDHADKDPEAEIIFSRRSLLAKNK